MPSFLILNSRGIAMTFLCVDMYYCWLVGILDTTEHLNKTLYIVAFLQILILKSPCLKPIVLALATALSQRTQILVYTAVVLGCKTSVSWITSNLPTSRVWKSSRIQEPPTMLR